MEASNVGSWFFFVEAKDAVQHRWGGDLDKVQNFLNLLPQVIEIRMVVMLKLIEDSFTTNEKLFKGGMDNLVAFTNEQLHAMYQHLKQIDLHTLHQLVPVQAL